MLNEEQRNQNIHLLRSDPALSTLQLLAYPHPFAPKCLEKPELACSYLVEVPYGHDLGRWPLAELLFHPELELLIPLHGEHIEGIGQQQQQAFPPDNEAVQEEENEHHQVKDVEGDVTEQGPPGKVEDLSGEEGTGADDKEDVEHSRAHNGADAHIAVGDEDANEGGEQLRGRASSSHERGTCHILRDLQLVRDDTQGWDEVLITHNGQGHKHIHHAKDVQKYPALLPLLHTEQVWGVLCLGVVVWSAGGQC